MRWKWRRRVEGAGKWMRCADFLAQESHNVCSFRIDDTGVPVWVSEVSTGDAKPCNVLVVTE